MHAIDERALLDSYQPNNLEVARQLTGLYQAELLRTAFLLTGNRGQAIALARHALLDFFDNPPDAEQERGRETLLLSAARTVLRGETPSPAREAMAEMTVGSLESQQRYQVEDQYSRLLQALERLDREERVAVVLRDHNLLHEERVCQLLGVTPFVLRNRLEGARERLREAASLRRDQTLTEGLNRAALRGPRMQLWPEIEEDLEERAARAESRRQTITAGIIVGMLLLLGGTIFWLAGGLPGSDEPSAASMPTATEIPPTPTPTPEPTVTPTPIPELSSFMLIQGQVPDHVWLQEWSQREQLTSWQFSPYDPLAGETLGEPIEGFPRLISQDGRWLLVERGGPNSTENGGSVALVETATGEVRWELEQHAYIPNGAFAGDRVYLMETGDLRDARVQVNAVQYDIVAYSIETGEEVARWSDLVDDLSPYIIEPDLGRVSLAASPDGSRLFVSMFEHQSSSTGQWGWRLATYRLPSMELEAMNLEAGRTGPEDVRRDSFATEFDIFSTHVTPDGRALVDVVRDRVLFRGGDSDEDLDLEIPFAGSLVDGGARLIEVVSNSGRYLYLIAPDRFEMAVVDLLGRRVERVFPIDVGAFEPVYSPDAFGVLSGVVSLDGERLYLMSSVWQAANTDGPPIWVLDLTTGSIIGRWDQPVVEADEGRIVQLGWATPLQLVDGGQRIFYFTEAWRADGRDRVSVLVDTTTGDVAYRHEAVGDEEQRRGVAFVSPFDLYRSIHHRSPALGDVEPADAAIESTLPKLRLVPQSDAVAEGVPVDLEFWMLDPARGERLTEPRDDVRFDPDADVVLTLRPADGDGGDITLIMQPEQPGLYRARATFTAPGVWDATVVVTGDGENVIEQKIPASVDVATTLEGNDGRRYIVQLETEPDRPAVDEETAIRLVVVDAESGAPLPEDVDLIDGLPANVTVTFFAPNTGFHGATLDLTEHGVYEGDTVEFWEHGDWRARIAWEAAPVDGERHIEAGSISVEE